MKLKRLALIFSLIFMFLTQASFAVRGDIRQLYDGQTIDDMVIQFMIQQGIPGLSMSIVQAPYIPRVVGYGLADVDSKRLVATNTMFNVGQMKTAYMAVAVMQLVEQNKLQLSDSIGKYIPNLPSGWEKITVNDLFTHSSGLPSYVDVTGYNASQNYTTEQIIDLIRTKTTNFQPGSNVSASATDFFLLGMIIEKASGMRYTEFITKHQFATLGLKHTVFVENMATIQNEIANKSQPFKHSAFKNSPVYINPTEPATGYTLNNGQLTPVGLGDDTALFSSAEDISFWDIALAGDILIKDEKNRAFLYNSVKLPNGKVIPGNAGWQFPGRPGLMFVEGNVPGYSSFLSRFTAPTELVCVTLLANRDNVVNLEILGRKIAGAYDIKLGPPLGAPWTEMRESPYSVAETLDRFIKVIHQQGGKVFARIDHSGEAAKAGQQLSDMQVVVVGNPSKGMALMQAKNEMAIDLPLRALVWKDKDNQVWLSYTNPIALGKLYDVQGQDALLMQMYIAISTAAMKATNAY